MKHGLGTSVGLLAWLGLTAGVRAAMNDSAAEAVAGGGNPYHAIVVRNVFDLHPPPPVIVKEVPKPPPANVKLTGLTLVFGKKQAYFSVMEVPPPGKPAGKLKYYTLGEHERRDGLEVKEIDIQGQKVKIEKDGDASELTLEKAKSTGGSAGGGAMAQVGGRLNPLPAPNYAPPAAPAAPNIAYNPRYGGAPPANNNPQAGALSQIPRPVRTPDQPMDPETQIIMMELERERTRESVAAGQLPPIPITPLTELPAAPETAPGAGGPPAPVR
jgi:hypothetical protein